MKTSVIHPKFLFIANERTAGLASPAPLARLSITEGSSASKSLQGRDYLIVCSTDEVRCFSSQSKDRVGKVEWKFSVQHAELIERGGAPSWVAVSNCALTSQMHIGHFALIAFTRERETLVYSIPHLEFCHRLHLEEGPSRYGKVLNSATVFLITGLPRLGTISSDSTGDYIEVFTPPLPPEYPFPITLSTLFPSRRPRFPNINFGEPVRPLPPQPGPPANEASYTAWLWGPKVYNGKEIDNIREDQLARASHGDIMRLIRHSSCWARPATPQDPPFGDQTTSQRAIVKRRWESDAAAAHANNFFGLRTVRIGPRHLFSLS